jgi:hypothetical protein
MPSDEQPVYHYGDFPGLFWDLKRDEVVDGTNPTVVARVLEHAEPETVWKLIPMNVLLKDFERIDLPEHTRHFWRVAVHMLRDQHDETAPDIPQHELGITYHARPRFHQRGQLPRPVKERETYLYGDLPELFWDRNPGEPVNGADPAVLARLLEDAPPEIIWKIVPVDVLLRNFESLDLKEHTRRFWSVAVAELRKRA